MTAVLTDDREPARPDFDDLTPAEQAEHREHCSDGCVSCDGFRAFGVCSECGRWVEAIEGRSNCCTTVVDLEHHASVDASYWLEAS
ncbi:hypothetical protein [Microbacterium sp. A1-JK]|uniref:hypothetical protein n=1 Tax=Microbacterium sp. A1-JK TaxID=3177516 RepID=UPI0038850DE6